MRQLWRGRPAVLACALVSAAAAGLGLGAAQPGASAEWIVEAPTDSQTNTVGAINPFSPVVVVSGLAGDGPVQSLWRVTLLQSGAHTASPSDLGATGFEVASGPNRPPPPG